MTRSSWGRACMIPGWRLAGRRQGCTCILFRQAEEVGQLAVLCSFRGGVCVHTCLCTLPCEGLRAQRKLQPAFWRQAAHGMMLQAVHSVRIQASTAPSAVPAYCSCMVAGTWAGSWLLGCCSRSWH